MVETRTRRTWRDVLTIHGSALLALLIAFFVAFQFVNPAPPKRITMAAGPASGAYFSAAQSYGRLLAEHGIALDVIETAGSVENLHRLTRTAEGAVDIALVQGGVKGRALERGADGEIVDPGLVSLASVYYEPVWVFHRQGEEIAQLRGLAGKRVSVGPEGSGTRELALELLAVNGITAANARLLGLTGRLAAKALVDAEIDCVFLVAGAGSPLVRELLADSRLKLMSFDRAKAYVGQHRFLSTVALPEGSIDLAANVPQSDVQMIAASANLVARPSLHPALVDLLLIAASEVHGRGGLFEASGQFPSDRNIDFPLSTEARRYFKYGPPFLMRTLPFWAATLVDRLKVMLLPLLALMLPLMRILPPVYRWRVRSRIYRWYHDLGAIEAMLHEENSNRSLDDLLAALGRIEAEVRQVSVPGSYEEEHYHLRVHIDFVRERIDKSIAAAAAAGGEATTRP